MLKPSWIRRRQSRCAHIRVLRTRARDRGCAGRCLSVGPIPRVCKPSRLKLRLRPRLSPGITTSFCRTPPVAGRISSLPSEDFAQVSILRPVPKSACQAESLHAALFLLRTRDHYCAYDGIIARDTDARKRARTRRSRL